MTPNVHPDREIACLHCDGGCMNKNRDLGTLFWCKTPMGEWGAVLFLCRVCDPRSFAALVPTETRPVKAPSKRSVYMRTRSTSYKPLGHVCVEE